MSDFIPGFLFEVSVAEFRRAINRCSSMASWRGVKDPLTKAVCILGKPGKIECYATNTISGCYSSVRCVKMNEKVEIKLFVDMEYLGKFLDLLGEGHVSIAVHGMEGKLVFPSGEIPLPLKEGDEKSYMKHAPEFPDKVLSDTSYELHTKALTSAMSFSKLFLGGTQAIESLVFFEKQKFYSFFYRRGRFGRGQIFPEQFEGSIALHSMDIEPLLRYVRSLSGEKIYMTVNGVLLYFHAGESYFVCSSVPQPLDRKIMDLFKMSCGDNSSVFQFDSKEFQKTLNMISLGMSREVDAGNPNLTEVVLTRSGEDFVIKSGVSHRRVSGSLVTSISTDIGKFLEAGIPLDLRDVLSILSAFSGDSFRLYVSKNEDMAYVMLLDLHEYSFEYVYLTSWREP